MGSEPQPVLVQAVYSYKGKNNDELCFKKGDIITVTQMEEGGWWEGTFGEKTGWFPSNYVKEYRTQNSLSPVAPTPPELMVQQKVYRSVVLKDMIDSEKAHVTELQGLMNNFLKPLEASDLIKPSEYHQLVGNLSEVIEMHEKLLGSLEEISTKPAADQRVGHLFLTTAPRLKHVHMTYCSSHPKAVCILDKYKNELSSLMEAHGAASPGLLVLTTGLSKPFRRLDKYGGMLTELERHLEEAHIDRGDTQRSVHVFKDIASSCSIKRRQKEMELEVVNGGVRGWEGEDLANLGEIIYMGSVAVGIDHRDRYLALFPTTLLMLSVSQRLSAFIYEGKLPLTGISINKLEDTESYKNAFEIVGPMIERIVAVCQTKEDQQQWVDLIRGQIRSVRISSPASSTRPPPTPPHNSMVSGSSITQHWSVSCLRPSPPTRFRENRNTKKTSERSFEEDGQILKVIEAYCTSAKTRYTVNSAVMDLPPVLIAEEEKIFEEDSKENQTGVQEKSLVDTVYALKDEVKALRQKMTMVSHQLEEEKVARNHLQTIIHNLVMTTSAT